MENVIIPPVGKILWQLYGDGKMNKAVLASARHANSVLSPQAQAVWPAMIAELPQSLLSRDGKPTYAETAVYAAIRLYAIHQQGTDTCVYAPAFSRDGDATGMPLFSALAHLRQNETTRVALDRRVQPLLATTNIESVIQSLSHLVAILKANQRAFQIDYARLGQDLYYFQMNYELANQIRLLWGQQYFATINQPAQTQPERKKD